MSKRFRHHLCPDWLRERKSRKIWNDEEYLNNRSSSSFVLLFPSRWAILYDFGWILFLNLIMHLILAILNGYGENFLIIYFNETSSKMLLKILHGAFWFRKRLFNFIPNLVTYHFRKKKVLTSVEIEKKWNPKVIIF